MTLSDFAAPAALYDLIEQLDLVATIAPHAGKRAQGVSVGAYIALAALNRCLAPTSKARLAGWYTGTVLRLLPIPTNLLTSQRFWDHMSYLDADKIAAIEQDLTRRLIDRFHIELSCLFYDTTNFYTFIDTFNEASGLAQRGKSKEKRMDLRKDFHIPLFQQVELSSFARKRVDVVAAACGDADVSSIRSSRRHRPVVRLQDLAPVVILNAEHSQLAGAVFQSHLPGQSRREETDVELAPAIDLKDPAGRPGLPNRKPCASPLFTRTNPCFANTMPTSRLRSFAAK